MNSIGNLMLHLCGNLRWRFRAIISGLPDDRDRPREFSERGPIPKEELLRRLEAEVAAADAVLAGLTSSQLLEIRNYRMLTGERRDAVQLVVLQTLLHLSGHAQEIIYITRLQLGDAYQFRSPPAPDAKTIAADDMVFTGGMLPAHAPTPQAGRAVARRRRKIISLTWNKNFRTRTTRAKWSCERRPLHLPAPSVRMRRDTPSLKDFSDEKTPLLCQPPF